MWQISIVGEQADVGAIRTVARFAGYEVAVDQDGQTCLGGAAFEAYTDAGAVRSAANDVLNVLNGLARLEFSDHKPVRLGGAVIRYRPDGRRDITFSVSGGTIRVRSSISAVLVDANGVVRPPPPDPRLKLVSEVMANPKLREIMAALAGDLSWQRLRVAFEKIAALIANSERRGKFDNALVRSGYARQPEIDSLKANAQDPRHSGLDAVHGVADTADLKGAKMSLNEGRAFVARLVKIYVERNSAA